MVLVRSIKIRFFFKIRFIFIIYKDILARYVKYELLFLLLPFWTTWHLMKDRR